MNQIELFSNTPYSEKVFSSGFKVRAVRLTLLEDFLYFQLIIFTVTDNKRTYVTSFTVISGQNSYPSVFE